ncbi:MAG TPA: MASE1 domain-containing protein, partial [Pyrinomonadaceae bacterium]
MSDALTLASHRPAAASRDDATFRRTLVVALLVGVGYYLTAKIGFAFSLQPGSVSTLWMPNSILLAGLLLVPKRNWWMILVVACPAHFASELQSGVPTAMILSWFISNSFQALFGAFFICKFVDDGLRFDKLRDLTIFLFFGAFLAPFLSSFLDVALVKLNGWGTSSYWDIWRVRCLSNILATLTLVPVIMTWANGGITAARRARWWHFVEAGVLTAGLVAVGLSVFESEQALADNTPSLLYWPLPFLLWATVRFGPRGVSTG